MKNPIQNIASELFYIEGVAEIHDIEGYRYDYENRKALFGTRLGPVSSIPDGLLHEIAHTAEIKDLSKLHVFNFGLEIKTKFEFLGKVYAQPITWNAIKLEARVILWQEVLCEVFGYSFDREKFATALEWMPDFTNVPIKGYKFDSDISKYVDKHGVEFVGTLKEQDKLRFQSINDYMTEQKALGIYTYSEFRKRWEKVLEFIELN